MYPKVPRYWRYFGRLKVAEMRMGIQQIQILEETKISHVEKRKIINSNVPSDGICWFFSEGR